MKRALPYSALVLLFFLASFAAAADEILLGNIQDLSGPNKAFGLATINGAQMYFDKVNEAGGINGMKLKVISYDTKSEVNEAISAYRRLCDLDKVSLVIGPPIANMGIALAPITDGKKVPIIGLYMDERATTKPDGKPWPYMFLAQNSSGAQARTIAQYAIKELKVKKYALLYNQQNAYSVSLAEPFVAFVTANGGTIVAKETFMTADKDYRAQLTKIKQANPEAIYMPNYPQEIPLTLQQSYDLGIKAIILGDNSYIPFALASNTDPKASEGVYFPYGIDPSDPKLKDFGAQYEKKYGYPAITQAFSGWDLGGATVEAYKRALAANKKPSGDLLAAELGKTKDFPGYQGSFTLSPQTHRPVGLTMYILQVKGGKPV
ncbi:MAG TPA: ABC transporter substrate-binding protein, partial [Thermodesulfobacteriota bacterium]|nr:ABC transporter substrate-binding protein [Thermodesulfobacteriota bacterium]